MQVGHLFGCNPTLVQIVFQNALNWPKWNFLYIRNFTDFVSSVLKDKFHHIFMCFACWWTYQAFSIFNRGYTVLKLGKLLNTCVLPIIYWFHHFRSFHSIFPTVRAKFVVSMLFFQVCHFLDIPELQMEQHTLVLQKTLVKNAYYDLIPRMKWLIRVHYIYTYQQHFMLAAVGMILSGQSRN